MYHKNLYRVWNEKFFKRLKGNNKNANLKFIKFNIGG